jgi:hypothetical protein
MTSDVKAGKRDKTYIPIPKEHEYVANTTNERK